MLSFGYLFLLPLLFLVLLTSSLHRPFHAPLFSLFTCIDDVFCYPPSLPLSIFLAFTSTCY